MPNLIAEYEATIKKLTELENFTAAKEFEQKLQILKNTLEIDEFSESRK
ncbi:tetratricopeptide repeat with 9 trp repeats domain protein, partial [Orientia tsutsugamushi str. UT144]